MDNCIDATPLPKEPLKKLPLFYCYLSDRVYHALVDHGVTDFVKVKAISCVKNPNAKNLDDYFITTVTHVQTEDGSQRSFAFYEFQPSWLDPTVPWRRLEDNFSSGFGELRGVANRHGIPIAFYFEDKERENGELEEMREDGIDPFRDEEKTQCKNGDSAVEKIKGLVTRIQNA